MPTTVALADDPALEARARASVTAQVRVREVAGGVALEAGDLAYLLMATHTLWRAGFKAGASARFGIGDGIGGATRLAERAAPDQVLCEASIAQDARRHGLAPVHDLGDGVSELFAADDP